MMQIRDNTNIWLIGLVALLIFGCVGLTGLGGLFKADMPGQLAEGDVEREVGPVLTATAGYLVNEGVQGGLNATATALIEYGNSTVAVAPYKTGAKQIAWGGLAILLFVMYAVGGYKLQQVIRTGAETVMAWLRFWKTEAEKKRREPTERDLGNGLKIVYPALGEGGNPMIVDTVTSGTWPLYDPHAVDEARRLYVERLEAIRRLAEAAEHIARSTKSAKPGDVLANIAEYSKVEVER